MYQGWVGVFETKLLYSTCVLYSGCSEKNQNAVQYLCTIQWVFRENLECCIVPVYYIVGVPRKFKMLYSTCVLYSGCPKENLECSIVPVYSGLLYNGCFEENLECSIVLCTIQQVFGLKINMFCKTCEQKCCILPCILQQVLWWKIKVLMRILKIIECLILYYTSLSCILCAIWGRQ